MELPPLIFEDTRLPHITTHALLRYFISFFEVAQDNPATIFPPFTRNFSRLTNPAFSKSKSSPDLVMSNEADYRL